MPRLMIVVACTLLPGLLVARGETIADASSTPAPSVAIFMDFDSTPGSSSVEIMKHEVDELLKPAGIRLDWRLVRDNDGKQGFSGVVLLKFKGRCRAESWSQPTDLGSWGDQALTLGATQVSNGRVLPFSEVKCDEVRKALAYVKPGAGQAERQRALGLALGRVVAHELYHILAGTTAHASEGLAKAYQSLTDLVSSGQLGFDPKTAEAIREGFLEN
jgi:hypothetical protein